MNASPYQLGTQKSTQSVRGINLSQVTTPADSRASNQLFTRMETRKGDESVRDDFFENVPAQKPVIENSRGEDIGDGISSSNAVTPRG